MLCLSPLPALAAGEISPELLLPTIKYNESNKDKPTKLSYVNQLPGGSWQEILAAVIKLILAITGTLTLISFTVSGVMMVTARGDDDTISKARNMLLWSIVGLAVIAGSYALVTGISQLNFFSGNMG